MNPIKVSVKWLLVIVLATYQTVSFAQISFGGIPPSFEPAYTHIQAPLVQFKQPDMATITAEDIEAASSADATPQRMAVAVKVGLNMDNSGQWTILENGDRVWQLSISVKDAVALGVYYDQFFLPIGSKLFLYNEDKNQLIGAYTHENNPESGLFATEFVEGDVVTLEYVENSGVTEKAVIHIAEVAYAYRFIEFRERETDGIRSLYCMIDVACEEGDDWPNQIRSVARISIKIGFNFYWCSGALINNTNNDRTPYFLTAGHCGAGSSTSDMNQWIFYFNYQAATCDGNGGGTNSMTGCQLKAKDASAGDNGSDFYLVQFNASIPNFYNVYYSGWNRTNVTTDMGNGVSIHHPAGDIKKISTYTTPLTSSTAWNGLPSHWRVNWANTTNGRSIVEGGSSGSPIFDSNGLIVGDLTGGYTSNTCENPSPAFYGKIWYSWDQNGSTPATRLKDWLDPTDDGIEKLPGVNWQPTPPVANFEAAQTTVEQGEGVFFTDLSDPGILSWSWTFEGGIPESSTEENPGPVIYSAVGDYTISLTVTNADGTDTETKVNYISVTPAAPPVADFVADKTEISQGGQVEFTDLSVGNPFEWFWEFEGGSPETSNEQNPVVSYSSSGQFDVSLTVTGYGGENQKIMENYINVEAATLPAADFVADQTQIMQGSTVNFTDLSSGTPDYWYWEFEGGNPSFSEEQHPQGVLYADGGAYNVSLTVVNTFGIHTKTVEEYIIVNWVGVEEFDKNRIGLFPNPSDGLILLDFSSVELPTDLKIFNTLGKLIYERTLNSENQLRIDLSSEPEGVYLLSLVHAKGTLLEKVILTK